MRKKNKPFNNKPFLIIALILIVSISVLLLIDNNENIAGKVSEPFAGGEIKLVMTNPSTTYCEDVMGYEYEIITEPTGEQKGICIMPDGNRCPGWQFYSGECGSEYSYCAVNGYETLTKTDGKDSFSPVYSVCVSRGLEIGSVIDLTNLHEVIASKSSGGFSLESKSSGSFSLESIAFSPGTPTASTESLLPMNFDWRDYNGENWMTYIKDQGNCGTCWAFSSLGMIEAVANIEANDPNLNLNLAEQYLVSTCFESCDCESGCDETDDLSFIQLEGVPDEECYPYRDTDSACSERCSDWENRLFRIGSFEEITGGLDELSGLTIEEIYEKMIEFRERIKLALIEKGPLSGSLILNGEFINNIYNCRLASNANHGVVIVGYNDFMKYWIVKNSHGSNWPPPNGDGYFQVAYFDPDRDSNNCYIELETYSVAGVKGKKTRITNGGYNTEIDVYDDVIVWQYEDRQQGLGIDIYAYRVVNPKHFSIYPIELISSLRSEPQLVVEGAWDPTIGSEYIVYPDIDDSDPYNVIKGLFKKRITRLPDRITIDSIGIPVCSERSEDEGYCNNQGLNSDPDIGGDRVVWKNDPSGMGYQLVIINILSEQETRLNTGLFFDVGNDINTPNINEGGGVFVWTGHIGYQPPNEPVNQIFSYRGGDIVEVYPDTDGQVLPRISGNKIVWTNKETGQNSNIYLYDLETGDPTIIGTPTGDQYAGDISGNRVVYFQRGHSECPDIWLYDISTGEKKIIDTADQECFKRPELAIDGNVIVWTQKDYNTGIDVYMYQI